MAGRARRRPQGLGPRRGWEETPPWPDGPNPASRPASLPFPAAPPATPGRRLAVPLRTPELGLERGAPRTHHCQRRAAASPSAPLFFPQNSQTRTPSRDPRPPPARDPFLPSSPPSAPTSYWTLAPPYWPACVPRERPLGGGAPRSTLRRRGRGPELPYTGRGLGGRRLPRSPLALLSVT